MSIFANALSPLCCILYVSAAVAAIGETTPLSETALPAAPANGHLRVYIGSYTNKAKTGITMLDLDTHTGALTGKRSVYEGPNPTYLVLSSDYRYLYAANEIDNFGGQKAGAVSAFAVDAATGSLRLLNQQSTVGDGPCHIDVDKHNKIVVVANYGGGSVASFPVEEGGKLGQAATFVQHEGKSVDPARQEGPHGHSFTLDGSNRYGFACDLGLDKIFVYKLNAETGTIVENDPPFATVSPGSGPRHIAFTPNNHFAYVCNEMLSTITGFAYDSTTGTLKSLETLSTLPSNYHEKGNSTAEIQVSPDGHFVYVSNRGHNSIAIFAINQQTGRLTSVGHQSTEGRTPRCFKIEPSGNWMLAANQDTDNVVVFKVDRKTGKLSPTGHTAHISMPVCVQYMPIK